MHSSDIADRDKNKTKDALLDKLEEEFIKDFYEDDDTAKTISVGDKVIHGQIFRRLVLETNEEGFPEKYYVILGVGDEKQFGLVYFQKTESFDQYWEQVEHLYMSVQFNDTVALNRTGSVTPFKNEYFEFDYTNNWEMNNLGDLVILTSPYVSTDDTFQENIIFAHQEMTEELAGLQTDDLLKKLATADKITTDNLEIIEEGEESIAGVTFKKQLMVAQKGQLEFVVIRYAHADGENAYFMNYTAEPNEVERMGDQFKQIINSLKLPKNENPESLDFESIFSSRV